MSNSALISVQRVRKRYGRKTVLRQVDLNVPAGRVVALLGPNGAGKTTLMRMVAGLASPDRGEIALGGVALSQAGHELRRYVGFVGHAPLLYDNLSGWDNLRFFARMYDMPQPDERIAALLRTVDLWLRRRDSVRTYSRGMTQRLAIARAILHDPPVLLLDEPDTGLDQESMQMLHRLVRHLGAQQRAVLFTTHQWEQALTWADEICILMEGRIVHQQATYDTTLTDLREIYANVSRSQ